MRRDFELDARPSDEKITVGGICMLVFTCLTVPIVMLGGESTGSTTDPSAAERRATIDVHARPWAYYTSLAQISEDIPITHYFGHRARIEPAVPKPLVEQYAKLHHGHQPQILPAWPINHVEHVRLRPPVPKLYELFDCVVHPSFSKASTRCNTLFCHSGEGEVQKCSKIAATMERKGAFVAFFGQDTHLSAVKDDVLNISRAFSRSYFSGVDIDLLGIDVMPIGLTEFYLRDQDYWNVLPLLHSPKPSSQRILAVANVHWNVTNTDRLSIKTLCASRYMPPEIDCTVSREGWWSRLHASTHILNPLGNGVQSSKFFEALLMRTIPICTRHLVFQKLFVLDLSKTTPI